MSREATQRLGAMLALAALALLVAVDVYFPPDFVILTALFGLAPLIACAVVPARGTALIAVLALGCAVFSGAWNQTTGTAQQNVRLVNVALIGIAAVAIAVVRVHRERQFAAMSQIAEVAQRAILPVLPAQVDHVAIAALYRSAAKGALVGGDLYDCYHSEDRVRLIVGDVRGKGILAVEQAARVIRAFRQAAALRANLVQVAGEMDDYLADFFDDEEFVTAVLVDVTSPEKLRVVSAGHPGPQLVTGSENCILDLPAGLPLGLGLGKVGGYVETDVAWSAGDRLLMYTDGLSEARNVRGDFFEVSTMASDLRSGPVETALPSALAAVSAHVPAGRLDDDLAVVLIENLPERLPTVIRPRGPEAG